MIGVCESLHEETEKIEHSISPSTLDCIINLVNFFGDNPSLLKDFKNY